MGKGEFFDAFDTQMVLTADNTAQLNDLLVQAIQAGSPTDVAQAQYVELLQQLLAAQGADVQAAKRDNPGFIYIEAATDKQQFEALLQQTAAAAECAAQSKAVAQSAKEEVLGSWEPPPADAAPETEEDYS